MKLMSYLSENTFFIFGNLQLITQLSNFTVSFIEQTLAPQLCECWRYQQWRIIVLYLQVSETRKLFTYFFFSFFFGGWGRGSVIIGGITSDLIDMISADQAKLLLQGTSLHS